MYESLILAGTLVQSIGADGQPVVVKQGALYQQNGIILDIGKVEELIRKYPHARHYGSMRHVLMPGFVNSHHHMGLTPLQLGSPDYASADTGRHPEKKRKEKKTFIVDCYTRKMLQTI